jgi:hypothetical protein
MKTKASIDLRYVTDVGDVESFAHFTKRIIFTLPLGPDFHCKWKSLTR